MSAVENLQNLILDLEQEKHNIETAISLNNSKIEESKKYLDSIYEMDDSEMKYFSPRPVEQRMSDQINSSNHIINDMQEQNKEKYHSLNILKNRLDVLKETYRYIVGQEADVFSPTPDKSISEIDLVLSKLEFCKKIALMDGRRVQQEIEGIIDILTNNSNNL